MRPAHAVEMSFQHSDHATGHESLRVNKIPGMTAIIQHQAWSRMESVGTRLA